MSNLIDKDKILKEEKENAMMKVASFNGNFQDPYPTPFLNLSDTHIPKTTIEIFKWCKYFYMFDPLISGAINALSTFPITELHLEDSNNATSGGESDILKTYKRVFFKNLNIHKLLIEIGIDYYLYGNCFIFGEMYINPATNEAEWKTMVRLDPSKMILDYNPATQEKKYKWEVPSKIAKIIRSKKPAEEYNKIPQMFKDAVKEGKAIVLNSNNVYHFSRPTDSMGDNAIWGTPVIANVLKLLMYRNVLRQAQEAIAREHIVPMRIYYIDKTDTYDPSANWNGVASDFAQELNKSVKDPNHKVVSPVPVNVITVGGQGKSLLLTTEIQQTQEEILAGMNIPREFIFGGISYSGSSISLRILENHFITYRLLIKDFLQNFGIKNMAKARKEWVNDNDDDSLITAKMVDLKMQDDVQQKQLLVQLNAAGKCTDEFLWKSVGIDPARMNGAIKREAMNAVDLQKEVEVRKAKAQLDIQKIQLEVQAELQLYQMQIQKKMKEKYPELFPQEMTPEGMVQEGVQQQPGQTQQQPGEQPSQQPSQQTEQPQQEGGITEEDIQNVALNIMKLPEESRKAVLEKIPQSLQPKVMQAMQAMQSSLGKKNDNKKIDMRPMPEKLPPRRDSLK